MSTNRIGYSQLNVFRLHFEGYEDHYVLIGGTATMILLSEARLSSRATKDLDIVLSIEALTREFVNHFWKFVNEGGYECYKKKNGAKCFYRFQKPTNESFPFMLELLTDRSIDYEEMNQVVHPLVLDDEIISLSAILLNQDYYQFLMNNKIKINGIMVVNEIALIPLKICAFLDLTKKKSNGESIGSVTINKHKYDVYRLVQLLTPDPLNNLPTIIKDEVRLFCSEINDDSNILRQLSLVIDDIETIKSILLNVYCS